LEELTPDNYATWTTLLLPPSPIGGDLGSLMFLSSLTDLAPEFLKEAVEWTNQIYLGLRAFEMRLQDARRVIAEANAASQSRLRQQQTHAIGTHLVYIRGIVKMLDTELQSSKFDAADLPEAISFAREKTKEGVSLEESIAELDSVDFMLGGGRSLSETEKDFVRILVAQ